MILVFFGDIVKQSNVVDPIIQESSSDSDEAPVRKIVRQDSSESSEEAPRRKPIKKRPIKRKPINRDISSDSSSDEIDYSPVRRPRKKINYKGK